MNNNFIQEEQLKDDQTINNISQIDSQITSLYNNLETINNDSNPNNKQQKILQQIKELEQLKSSLYTSINNSYLSTQSNVSDARNSLINEFAVTNIIGKELKNANKNLTTLEQERYNKVRMAEINNYYSDKYQAQTYIMKLIVYLCIPILILGILMKNEFIPAKIARILIGIIVGIGVIIIMYQLIDIGRRSNMDFSEYRFPFNPDDVDVNSNSNDSDQPKQTDYTLSCAGEACCPSGNTFGTVWDSTNKQCVTPSYQSSQTTQTSQNESETESFVGSKCLQNSFGKSEFNVNIFKGNNKKPDGYNDMDNNNFAKF